MNMNKRNAKEEYVNRLNNSEMPKFNKNSFKLDPYNIPTIMISERQKNTHDRVQKKDFSTVQVSPSNRSPIS